MQQTLFTPQNIIDNTYLAWARRESGKSIYIPFLIDYIKEQQQKYLGSFRKLIFNQLLKYDTRMRVEPGFKLPEYSDTLSFETLLSLMKKTFRSDMERNNVVWEKLTEALSNLEKLNITEQTVDKALFLFDVIHNAVHNTQTSIFNKFSNATKLLQAFNFCFEATPQQMKDAISSNVKEMFQEKKMSFKDFFASTLKESHFSNYEYTLPKDPREMIYDFYALSNAGGSLPGLPLPRPDELKDESLVFAHEQSLDKLLAALREKLLSAVFFALCAEFRHTLDKTNYMQHHVKDFCENRLSKEAQDFFKVYSTDMSDREDSSIKSANFSGEDEVPRRFREDNASRQDSYKAVLKTGYDRRDVVVPTMGKIFGAKPFQVPRASSYGGESWANIAKGWMMLYDAKSRQELIATIDHVYHLQHNTATVFNKLKSYFKGGYGWILATLDWRANLRNFYKLVERTSPGLTPFLFVLFKNYYGTDFEAYKNKVGPKTLKLPDELPSTKEAFDVISATEDLNDVNNPHEGMIAKLPLGTKWIYTMGKWKQIFTSELQDRNTESFPQGHHTDQDYFVDPKGYKWRRHFGKEKWEMDNTKMNVKVPPGYYTPGGLNSAISDAGGKVTDVVKDIQSDFLSPFTIQGDEVNGDVYINKNGGKWIFVAAIDPDDESRWVDTKLTQKSIKPGYYSKEQYAQKISKLNKVNLEKIASDSPAAGNGPPGIDGDTMIAKDGSAWAFKRGFWHRIISDSKKELATHVTLYGRPMGADGTDYELAKYGKPAPGQIVNVLGHSYKYYKDTEENKHGYWASIDPFNIGGPMKESFKSYVKGVVISEGGHAVENVTRIQKAAVSPTVETLEKIILKPIGLEVYDVLGSAGKKETSGDIDVSIETKNYEETAEKIKQQLKKYNIQFNELKQSNVISIRFPIYKSKDFVQIDLILNANTDLTSFAFYSPDEVESKYSGTHRTQLLRAIANAGAHKILQKFPNGKPKIIQRMSLSSKLGLNQITQSYEGANGKLLAAPKTIKSVTISNKPAEIIRILLGKSTTIYDVMSTEAIIKKMMKPDFPFKNNIKSIIDVYTNDMASRKFDVPKELTALHESTKPIFERLLEAVAKQRGTDEAPKMRSIPHVYQMTIEQLMEFLGKEFHSGDIEVSAKCDGWNASIFTLDGKLTSVKSKKGLPKTDPADYYAIAEKLTPAFKGFGDLMIMMNNAHFPQWIQIIEKEYKQKIIAQTKLPSQNFHRISIFGEMFNNNVMNTLVYSKDAIGKGALIIFGCVVQDGSVRGFDISTTSAGKEIMAKFVEQFNGADGWKVYYKTMIPLKFKDIFINGLQKFINQYKDVLLSRKHADRPAKEKAKKKLSELLYGWRNDIVNQVQDKFEVLGSKEIEGVVMRNIKTGAIAKAVDEERFSKRNIQNWAGNEEYSQERGKLLTTLFSTVLKGADIFSLHNKQIEKLADYLQSENKTKFTSIEEIFNVLYEDAKNEVEFDNAKNIAKNINNIVANYLVALNDVKIKHEKLQQNPKTKILDNHYRDLMIALKREQDAIIEFNNTIQELAKSGKDPLIEIIRFALGPKTVDELTRSFVAKK